MSRILIAEDDVQIASFVGKGLRAAGYTVEHVADGETALLMGRSPEIDMIILDIGLPAMDGFSVLQQLRGEGVSTLSLIHI